MMDRHTILFNKLVVSMSVEAKGADGEWKPAKIAWIAPLNLCAREAYGPNGSRVIMERFAVEIMYDQDKSHVVVDLARVRLLAKRDARKSPIT